MDNQHFSLPRVGKLLAAFCLAGSVLAMPASAETIPQRVEKGESVRHGIANDAPYGYIANDGSTVGLEVDLVRAVLAKMGIENKSIEPVVTTFGALIPGIRAERFDIASDGIYVRPERCKQVTFGQPHLVIGEGAIMLASAPNKPTSVEEMAADKSLRIGMTTGGSQDKGFLLAGGNADQLLDFPDRAGLLAALKAGRIDLALLTSIGAAGAVNTSNDPTLELLQPFKPYTGSDGKPLVSYGAFAFSHENADFVKEFNQHLVAFITSQDYAEMVKKYHLPAEVIPTGKENLEELCQATAE